MLNLRPLRHDLRPKKHKKGINIPFLFLLFNLHNKYYQYKSERYI